VQRQWSTHFWSRSCIFYSMKIWKVFTSWCSWVFCYFILNVETKISFFQSSFLYIFSFHHHQKNTFQTLFEFIIYFDYQRDKRIQFIYDYEPLFYTNKISEENNSTNLIENGFISASEFKKLSFFSCVTTMRNERKVSFYIVSL
jgi:hypothetical protein